LLGASYLLRALADGSRHLQWLGWFTPLGWTERIEPFTGPRYAPVALVLVMSAAVFAVAVFLREKRDTGGALLAARAGRDRPRVIGSALALDWYLSTGALVAWAGGIFVGLFVLGYLTHDMARFADENPSIDDMIKRIYGFSMSTAAGFLSLAFSVVALVLAVYAGTHMLNAREEETAGRVEGLVVGGTSRTRWLISRIGVALGAMLGLALVAAIGAWAGANLSGSSVGLIDVVEGSYNVIPTALLFGGLSVLAFGVVPRATIYVAFGAVTFAFLIQIIGGLSSSPAWVTKLSPFSHIAPVPAASVDVVATLVMLGVAVASTAFGVLAFSNRDLA
jgi:ABC-2 type transport system permease protein